MSLAQKLSRYNPLYTPYSSYALSHKIQSMKERKNILLPLGITARKLHVTTKWLKGEADANRIPHLKAGDRYLFEFSTVNDLLVERAAKGGGDE